MRAPSEGRGGVPAPALQVAPRGLPEARAHLDLPQREGLGMPVHPRLPQRKQPAGEAAGRAVRGRAGSLPYGCQWAGQLPAEPEQGLDPHTPQAPQALETNPRARAEPWAGAADEGPGQPHVRPPRSSAGPLGSLGHLPAFHPGRPAGPSFLPRSFSPVTDARCPGGGPCEWSSKTRCFAGQCQGSPPASGRTPPRRPGHHRLPLGFTRLPHTWRFSPPPPPRREPCHHPSPQPRPPLTTGCRSGCLPGCRSRPSSPAGRSR